MSALPGGELTTSQISLGELPFIGWSAADPRTLYMCRVPLAYTSPLHPPLQHLLFRSRDGGSAWTPLVTPQPASSCDVHLDAAQAGVLVLNDDRRGTFLSRDAGDHWQVVPSPPGTQAPYGMGLGVLLANGRIFVGGYWTTDLQHWTQWDTFPKGDIWTFAVDASHPDTIYAVMRGCTGVHGALGVCRTDDGGHTWRMLLPLGLAPGTEATVCVAPAAPNVVIAWNPKLDAPPGGPALEMSQDGGSHWQTVEHVSPAVGMLVPPDASCSWALSTEVGEYGLSDNGTLFHYAPSQETFVAPPGSIPAGISVFLDGSWRMQTPYPLADAQLARLYGDYAFILTSSSTGGNPQSTFMAVGPTGLYRFG